MNVIEIKNLSKSYKLYERNVVDRFRDTFLPGKKKYHKEYQALKNINLTVGKGEVLGIVGRNGAGKSTLLKIIAGITQPTSGSVSVNGRVVALLELGSGFNPEYTGKENIYYTCALQGMKKEEVDAIYEEIVEFSELGEFIDLPVKKYSSGMKARLGFATSINIDPSILILDEVLSVGDELFKRKCFAKMEEFFESGKTILFVSHGLSSIMEMCSRVLLIHQGETILSGEPNVVIPRYRQLLNSINSENTNLVEQFKALDIDNDRKQKISEKKEWKSLEEEVKPDSYNKSKSQSDNPYFLSDFISKSQKVIKNRNIDIVDCEIVTNEGNVVNHLLVDENYTLNFKVHPHEVVQNVSIGAFIYSARNKDLASVWFPGLNESISEIAEEEVYFISLPFKTVISEGIYGIRLIVKCLDEEEIRPVYTFIDAYLFRVMSEDKVKNTFGLVRFFSDSQCEILESQVSI